MLKEYIEYLLRVRNSLIQAGAEIPLTPIESYRDTFREGIRLDSVAWLYSVLSIGGSGNALSGCTLPISGYYRERMRQVFYREFLEYRQDYRKLSVANYVGSVSPAIIESGKSEEPEDLYENVDIFPSESEYMSEPEELVSEPVVTSVETERVEHVLSAKSFLADIMGKAVTEAPVSTELEIVHGTYIEDIVIPEWYGVESDDEYDIGDRVIHGVFIEDIDTSILGIPEDDSEGGFEVVHGTYIEDIVIPDIDSSGGFDGEEIHGIFIEDIEIPEEYDEDSTEDNDGWEEWKEDSYKEPDSEDDLEEDIEEDFEEENDGWDEWEEESFEEPGAEPEEDLDEEDLEEDDGWDEWEEESFEEPGSEEPEPEEEPVEQFSSEPVPVQTAQPRAEVESKPDLAESITNTMNSLLTKGKILIYKEMKKKK